MFNICNVIIEKTTDNNIICGSRFVNDGSTGNMENHLRCKHDLSEEKRQKVQDKFIQQTLHQAIKVNIKPHKESKNNEI
ncbi:hypothetical protein Glove_216g5 [Diversispora epigaea]|uniref:BED-type domain-containing protein n=1 Tax=Diversispora epigaea TaxID=1348612 RepID=A0A397IH03_9GLOM|nr:hypothetical protein Glove_216g5 [Diversispora epigaea]